MSKNRGNASRRKRVPRVPARTIRTGVSKAQVDQIVRVLNERAEFMEALRRDLDAVRHDTDIQFKRTAQIQADLDLVKRKFQ